MRHGKVSFDLKAKQFTAAASAPAPIAYARFKDFLSEERRAALYAEPFQALLSGAVMPTARLFEEHFISAKQREAERSSSDTLSGALRCDQRLYLPDNILVKVDRISMSHSLEARVPFLDHELAEWLNALPPSLKLRGFEGKRVLRRALSGRVPPELLKRKKAGFNVPMAQWLCGPLRSLSRDLLSPASVRRVGLWRPAEVSRLLDEHEERRQDHSRPLWAMLSFMLFNERFRGGRAAY